MNESVEQTCDSLRPNSWFKTYVSFAN